jgi:peptidase E
MANPGLVYLQGSGNPSSKLFGTFLDRAFADLGGRTPRVAVSFAPIAGNAGIIQKFSGWFVGRTFRGADVKRFIVAGERDAQPSAAAQKIVEEADLVFLSGGDPVVGARLLVESGADAWLRSARERGATLAGGSAGAILLGAWWASWPDDFDDQPFDGGRLVPCTRVVDDLVVDTHAEDDDWEELKMVRGMLRKKAVTIRARGIPTSGGLFILPDGQLEPVGDPPFVIE